jgi:hypothetical protein
LVGWCSSFPVFCELAFVMHPSRSPSPASTQLLTAAIINLRFCQALQVVHPVLMRCREYHFYSLWLLTRSWLLWWFGMPAAVPSRDPASIGRLVLQSLGSPDWWAASSSSWQALEGALLATMAKLRLAVQDATCAAVVTCPASKAMCIQGAPGRNCSSPRAVANAVHGCMHLGCHCR